jgi:hypothetical protein
MLNFRNALWLSLIALISLVFVGQPAQRASAVLKTPSTHYVNFKAVESEGALPALLPIPAFLFLRDFVDIRAPQLGITHSCSQLFLILRVLRL